MGNRTFYYGKGYRYAGIGSLLAAVLCGIAWLLIPGDNVGMSVTAGILSIVLGLGGGLLLANGLISSITVSAQELTVRSILVSRTFRWEHVSKIHYSLATESFVLDFRGGRPVRISRYYGDIASLVRLLDQHINTYRFTEESRNVIESILNPKVEEY